VQRLPGNAGYLEVRGFWPAPLVSDAFAAAIGSLQGSNPCGRVAAISEADLRADVIAHVFRRRGMRLRLVGST